VGCKGSPRWVVTGGDYFNPLRLIIARTSVSFNSLCLGTGSETVPLVYMACGPLSRSSHQPFLSNIRMNCARFMPSPLDYIIRIKCAFVNTQKF
jgi:hypothetical protein